MNFRKIYSVTLFLSFFIDCNVPQPRTLKDRETHNYDIAGHYQFFTTGGGFKCETIKHEFDFDTSQTGGTFLYHVFCHPFYGDSTGISSILKPFSMIGKWRYTNDSSIIELTADNRKVIRLKIENKKIESFLDENNKELPSQIFFYSSK